MNVKMIAGITLIMGIVSIAFLGAPIQAYFNGTATSDVVQTQDRERLRTQNRDGTCECTQTQNQHRHEINECATNRTCSRTMSMEQFRNQRRERTNSQGN
ncbi:MAG: hypothetical protein OEX09_02080 [Candidatus Bathyarchaeota archaeon]|nr:hypothetical protein [Candidatus Bathyarchaeota archaeon]MDH5732916.1 hypothetical protein [Candidatus Bathyarchaeota archaeon]